MEKVEIRKDFILTGNAANLLKLLKLFVDEYQIKFVASTYVAEFSAVNFNVLEKAVVLCAVSKEICEEPCISIMPLNWWSNYHNRRIPGTTRIIQTYNIPSQQDFVLNNIVICK